MSDIELARFATLAASLLKGAQSLLRYGQWRAAWCDDPMPNGAIAVGSKCRATCRFRDPWASPWRLKLSLQIDRRGESERALSPRRQGS